MEYGVANEITMESGEVVRTPIGYVSGINNIRQYNIDNNNSSPRRIIEISQLTIPEGLSEIIL